MCDCVVAVGDETAAGVTLFGKNSDRKGGECQPFVQIPEAAHAPHGTLRCTHVEIPQVAETYRVMGHSPWWVWGFEHGVNEHGVAIGNLTVFSNEPLEEEPGLIGMDLVRLGLERGRSAREALEVIAALLEKHGQGGPALAPDAAGYHNAFVLADPAESWLLETSNRRWGARRTRLGAESNHYALGTDWEIGARDLEVFARLEGLWKAKGRVDVARAYRNPHVPPHISSGRHRRAGELLAEARGRHDRESFAALLRDHGDRGPSWIPDSAPEDERHFTLCAHSEPVHWTTASIIAPLPAERAAPWPVWISFGTPCTGVFLPVYVDGAIPAALAKGGEEPEPDSAWWTFEALRAAVSADPPRHTSGVREGWRALEGAVESERVAVEAEARTVAGAGDADRARVLVSDFMERTVEAALARAEELRARIAD